MSKLFYSLISPDDGFSADKLGGKGFNLWKMKQAGVNVPPAYIIPTAVCREYMKDPKTVMEQVETLVLPKVVAGLKDSFGYLPLVSVRSGAKFSMPGMMDTILNVGFDHSTFPDWQGKLGNKCAIDSYSRLVEMYGNVVCGIERKLFEGKSLPARLSLFQTKAGHPFPDAVAQLYGAVEAVFKSWNNDRAKTYRKLNNIPDDLGTAVIIQAMVFGNMGEDSCTGVMFSRDPATGANVAVGEFLVNAQGEDVVAGIRTPSPLSELAKWNPEVSKELLGIADKLESMNGDMQDIEFTVQKGELFILQTRNAKRTAQAAVRAAVEMLESGMLTPAQALERVTAKQFLTAAKARIQEGFADKVVPHGKGIPASVGCVTGVAVFTSEEAVKSKEPCILIREETSPDDLPGINAAKGILTRLGGLTSHAAVVARGMDKVCVVGCEALSENKGKWGLKDSAGVVRPIAAGTKVTLDGASGHIWVGVDVPIQGGVNDPAVRKLLGVLNQVYPFYVVCTSVSEFGAAKNIAFNASVFDTEVGSIYPRMAGVLAAAAKLDSLVLDIRPLSGFLSKADSLLYRAFGSVDGEVLEEKLKALEFFSGDKSKILVLAPPSAHARVTKAGYALMETVGSLKDLLWKKGTVLVDLPSLKNNSTPEEVARMVELKAKAGEAINSFNIVSQVKPEQMNRSAVFALSWMQAVQSLLRQ